MNTTEREYRALWDSGGTHVWQGTTPGAPPAADLRLLSAAERAVMRRRPPAEGLRYAGAHIAVRRVLARYLGVPPAGIRFGTKPCPWCADPDHGRPVVIGPPTALDFNLSHAGPHWALAVTTSGQVGVDVEDGRSGSPAGAASLVMSPSELAHLDSLPDDGARQAAFLRCWTRKEAVVKAIGTGITADLKALEVRPEHPGPLVVHGGESSGGDDWLVQDLPGERGLFVALARPAGSTGPVLLRDPHAPDAGARHPGSQSVLEPFRS
ncbi:4'-phosphopantetheinyl transferase superfamily protein [Streptomyces sp. BE147]|uniref:4'-phosphopantetheinyl transferase family protein n=1 Tax=unclassified Streptomyces TaxID=2593676 RepID=UPI002E798450|nr:4'-phosphopantetheinyl transferase superfamily protein [Streptomyces sp. BE147]MEE1738085.1 4'-phosphopantetheinyl transferase superfamily protein [Streptomyces sp. BE147]